MTRKQIIYDNLIRLLEFITTGNYFDEYYGSLGEEQQTELLKIAEDIEVEKNLIRESRDNGVIEFSFTNLLPLLTKFSTDFNNYANNRLIEVFLLIELLSKLNDAFNDSIGFDDDSVLNIDEEEDVTNFSFVLLTKSIHAKNFVYYDPDELINSVCLLDLSDVNEIHNLLETTPLPVALIFQLLAKIGMDGVPLESQKYVLIRKQLEDKMSSIWACLAMHIVKSGGKIHNPYKYTTSPQVLATRRVVSGKEYQQFNDSLIILSEYNEKKDLLDKYIRLYHVMENFMFKYPLVKLERSHHGAVFSIRDFQRMYDKIKTSEITALTNLLKRVCDLHYAPGVTFATFILNKWQNLIPAILPDDTNLNSLIARLRITKKQNNEDVDINFGDFTLDNVVKYFSLIVYAFRNSLVHNRETEFHLTHETILNHPNIGDCARNIIEHFLIPVIEEVVFFLITNENEIVWFQESELILFEKN